MTVDTIEKINSTLSPLESLIGTQNLEDVRKFDGEENWIDASDLLYQILNGKFTLIKLPPQPIKVSKEDKIVIDYYKLCGYKWLVKDKDGEVRAYIDKPEKSDVSWYTSDKWEDDMALYDVKCVSWEDKEPFSLNREFEVVE